MGNTKLSTSILILSLGLSIGSSASAQTTQINGDLLAYRPFGSSIGNVFTLDRDSYVGTYITLAAPGNVTVSVRAQGTASGGINPHMNVVLADSLASFDVTSGFHDYSHTFSLPAGTFFLRTEFNNDLALTPRQLDIDSVSVTGAAVSNVASDANALAASDTYIANYRKGSATVNLSSLGLPAGTQVGVSLKRIAFNFGNAIPGNSPEEVDSYIGSGGTTKQTNYQAKLLQNFNAVTPENIGKWDNNEDVPGLVTMAGLDQVLDYAQAHSMYARLHTIIWDENDSNPTWVNTLRTLASGGITTAKDELRSAIGSRINYYLPSRATKAGEIDVYNESYSGQCCNGADSYWSLYGSDGIASMYNQAKQALPAAANIKLYMNEFEGLKFNAKGYFQNIETLRQAAIANGYGEIIGGIGTQDYPQSIADHSPSLMIEALQSFAVTGLPQTVTEYGAFLGVSPEEAATMLRDTLRLEFGNPLGTGFYMWGFQSENGGANLFAPAAALYTVNTSDWNNWTITPAGMVWQDLLGIQDWDGNLSNGWTTQLTATVDANGRINFNGYYGDYLLTINGNSYALSLVKGTNTYTIGALAGDFNGDGKVDAADYVWWRKNAGTPAQYATWRSHFGQSAGSGSAVNSGADVPEPSSIWLLVHAQPVVILELLRYWERRRRCECCHVATVRTRRD